MHKQSAHFILTTLACLSLGSGSLEARVAESNGPLECSASGAPGAELGRAAAELGDSFCSVGCTSFSASPVPTLRAFRLTALASNLAESSACQVFAFSEDSSLSFEAGVNLFTAQNYFGSDLGTARMDMNDHTISIGAPGSLTVASSIILENANLSMSNTTVTLRGGEANWRGINSVSHYQSELDFNITDPESPRQPITTEMNLSGVVTLGLGSSVYANPTLELSGQFMELLGSPGSQMVFAGVTAEGKTSQATFILTNEANSWSLGTLIQGATLTVQNSGAFPAAGDANFIWSPSGTTSNLVFQLDPADTYTGSGDFIAAGGSGNGWNGSSGTLTVESGTVNLSGDMTLMNLVLRGGITQLSGTNSLQYLNITPGAELQAASTDNLFGEGGIYQYALFNGGTLHVVDAGRLTLTGVQSPTLSTGSVDTSFTVKTDLDATMNFYQLQIGSSSTLDIVGEGTALVQAVVFQNVGTPLTLNVNGLIGGDSFAVSSSSTYSNTIILNSANAFLGDNTLVQGNTILQIPAGASILGEVFVNTGATISGSGSINGSLLVIGTLAPGSSPTTLTVVGDVQLHSLSTFSEYIEPGAAADLIVSGDVVIHSGVTLQIAPLPDCYQQGGESYQFLTAGSLTGTFDQVDTGTVLLQESLAYSPTSITLTVTPVPLIELASGVNGDAVAANIDAVISSGNSSFCDLVASFFPLTASEIAYSLNQLQPAALKAFAITQENNAVKVMNTLELRFQRELDSAHCGDIKKKPFHVWVNGLGDSLYQSSTTYAKSSQVGYHESMGGICLGVDYHFAKYLYAGVVGAYTDSQIKWGNSEADQGKGFIQSGYTGLYFSAIGKMFYGNVAVMGSLSHYDAHRKINLMTPLMANSKHGGAGLLSHADTGINIGVGSLGRVNFTIRPFDSFDYISQTENSFKEKGASSSELGNLNLFVHKNNMVMLRNELGINFASCFCVRGSKWTISPKISWVREVRIKGAQLTANFVGRDEAFTVTGYFPDRSLVSPGVSITGNMMEDLLTISLYYNGEFKGNYSDHSYGGQVRFGF